MGLLATWRDAKKISRRPPPVARGRRPPPVTTTGKNFTQDAVIPERAVVEPENLRILRRIGNPELGIVSTVSV